MRSYETAERLPLDCIRPVGRLAARPGFALAAVIVLAVGIGADVATFSIINGLLLRPLPYPDPRRS